MPLRNLLTIFFASVASFVCYEKADRNRFVTNLVEAMHIIDREYVEEVKPREVFENAMKGMVGGLDQYSAYISPNDYKHFVEELDQEIGGIGILVEVNAETQRMTVVSVLIDTPAYAAGLQAGDTIMEIEGTDTAGLGLREAVDLMRGKPGTKVHLAVLSIGDERPRELAIERAIIPLESVLGARRHENGKWDFELEESPQITYIRLTTFGEHSVEEVREVLQTRDVKALVLDLRDNSGGLLTAAVGICDLFVDGGAIVSTRGRDGLVQREFKANRETIIDADVPMVVLTNRFSASASEIVAACLQDHGRATVIGSRTWGKGTVQNVIPLEGGISALKLTTASYWRPSGNNIHRGRNATEEDDWGVRPNEGFAVEMTPEEEEKARRAYRMKDAILGNRLRGEEGTEDEEPFDDPQMRKAIEHLESRLNERNEAAEAA